MPSGTTVPGAFQAALDRLGDRPMLTDRAGDVRLAELLDAAARLATALERHGVRRGDRVGVWADNSRRWILCDLAAQAAGAVTVPRGTDTSDVEMTEILTHAEVGVLLAHDAKTARRAEGLRARIPSLREVVTMDPKGATGPTVDSLLAEGAGGASFAERAAAVKPDDVATIIYTSGTTGRPKGVVLAQSCFAHQIDTLPNVLGIGPTDVFLSILPPWHIFERTVEYVALTRGARLVFTDIRHFRQDLAEAGATFVPSVPRIWESVHDAVRRTLAEGGAAKRAVFAAAYGIADLRARAWDRARGHAARAFEPHGLAAGGDALVRAGAALLAGLLWPLDAAGHRIAFRRLSAMTGGRLRGAVVGGGKMAPHVDRFFRAVGVGVLVGYGLTETSPVLTVRREHRNVLHTIGTAIPGVELQIRDRDTGAPLGVGETGVVFTRGPQVMKGYFKDDDLTARAIDPQGWFDTGDLGALTEAGDLVFRGRQKETIVLSGGENVEPSRVEEAILPSPLVEQAFVVGQDRKTLAALVVPREAEVRRLLPGTDGAPWAEVVRRPETLALVREEVARRTGAGSGLSPFEVVARVAIVPEPLSTEDGCLTSTLKAKRHVIAERFAKEIEEAYA